MRFLEGPLVILRISGLYLALSGTTRQDQVSALSLYQQALSHCLHFGKVYAILLPTHTYSVSSERDLTQIASEAVAYLANINMDYNSRMSQHFRSQNQGAGGRGKQQQQHNDSDAFMQLVCHDFASTN